MRRVHSQAFGVRLWAREASRVEEQPGVPLDKRDVVCLVSLQRDGQIGPGKGFWQFGRHQSVMYGSWSEISTPKLHRCLTRSRSEGSRWSAISALYVTPSKVIGINRNSMASYARRGQNAW